jgi:hypothetical protein
MVFQRSDNAVLKSLYSDIGDLRMEVAFPFLLKVHNDCAEGVISEDDISMNMYDYSVMTCNTKKML